MLPNSTARNNLEAKIRYRSHRGMLELDLIFVPFSEQHLSGLSLEELECLSELLDEQDPDLHAWLMNVTEPENPDFQTLINRIRNSN